MKKVIMLCAVVMSSMMAEGQFSRIEMPELKLVFQQDGRFVKLFRDGQLIGKIVAPKGMPQDGAKLVTMFSSTLTSSEREGLASWNIGVQVSTDAPTNPEDSNITNLSSQPENPSTGSSSSTPKESSVPKLLEKDLNKKEDAVLGKFSQCMNYIKKQSLSVVNHVVINSQEYPIFTAAAVLVGGFGGFKAGEKIAQLAKFKKTGTRVTQVVSTISGAALATVGTWALLNKWYKA